MPRKPGGTAVVPSPYVVRRAAEAFELRAQGLTYRAIAAELGCAPATAFQAVEAGARLILREHGADQEIAMMILRLDEMELALRPKVLAGDTNAITAALRVQQRRARLLGLDAPARVELSGQVRVVTEDALSAEIAAREAELARQPLAIGPAPTDDTP